MTPKVASTCARWSRSYRCRNTSHSSTSPQASAAGSASSSPAQKLPVSGGQAGAEIGAQHVLHAMRQVDEIHHPEHQRQPRRDQEQQHPELQPVQPLHQKQAETHRRAQRIRHSAAQGSTSFSSTLRTVSVWNLPSARFATWHSQKSCTG